MIKCSNIILDSLARVGDRVFFNADEKGESWSYKSDADKAARGKTGTVFGFTLYEDYVPRYGRSREKPGVYMRRGAMVVRWDDGTGGTVSGHDVAWWPWGSSAAAEPTGLRLLGAAQEIKDYNEKLCESRQGERDLATEHETERVFLRVLPDVPIWEQDKVVDSSGKAWRVCRINWQYYGQRRDDGSFMPLLDLEDEDGGYTRAHDLAEVKLTARGNVWKWFNGQAEAMVFDGVEEESGFYRGLGRSRQIKNKDGVYAFDLDEALEAIRSGRGDGIGQFGGLFGSRSTTGVWKFDDTPVGDRVRAKTLEGFGIASA